MLTMALRYREHVHTFVLMYMFMHTQRAYAVLVMVLGVLAYGYIIASVAASLANADSARAQYQEKLKGIKSFMDVSTYHFHLDLK